MKIVSKNKNETPNLSYPQAFLNFMQPVEPDFPRNMSIEDVYEFGMYAWNIANMTLSVPEAGEEMKRATVFKSTWEKKVFQKLVKNKKKYFKEYDHYIKDLYFEDTDQGTRLTVTSADKDAFMEEMQDKFYENSLPDQYLEGFIDRAAIILRPKEPYWRWKEAFSDGPLDAREKNSSRIYLVEFYLDKEEVEEVLKEKYDTLFQMELGVVTEKERQWPRKRSYKLFLEWFDVEINCDVYDSCNLPVIKEI